MMDHAAHPSPDDCTVADYYEDPEHWILAGPGRKQRRTRLTITPPLPTMTENRSRFHVRIEWDSR